MPDPKVVPRKNPSSSCRVIDGQAVIAIADRAEIHILNEIGTRVWELIDGSRSIGEIVERTAERLTADGYENVPPGLGSDVAAFLEEIASKGMIELGG